MGAYLDTPLTDKNPETGSNNMCKWGVCSMQGWRVGMEDSHIAESIELPNKAQGTLFGVFDGHGGKEVAMFAKEQFTKILKSQTEFKSENYEVALRKAFMALDEKVSKEDYANDTGSTSCVILLTDTKIYCANAGDSRGVLCNNKKAVALSDDHKPDNELEKNRIDKAGHMVEDNRVDGNLALSRAFGDFQYKDKTNSSPEIQAVTANPDITCRDRNGQDEFIVLACDGIWDCLENQACIDKMNKYQSESTDQNLASSVEKMLDDILAPNTEDGIGTDNMTAILITLKK